MIIAAIFAIACFVMVAHMNKNALQIFSETNKKSDEKARKEQMINKDFQDELVRKIADPKYKKQITELIKEDLKYIYGDEWEKLFGGTWYTAKPYTIMFNSAENIVLFLMLSKSGLIPECYRFRRISISNFEVANAYECLKVLHCVEKNIRTKRGMEYTLLFNPLVYHSKSKPSVPQYEHPCSGEFYWAFESFRYNLPFVIKDIHSNILVENCKKSSIGPRSDKEKNNQYTNKLVL